MIVKTRVDKVGDVESYINLPVTNQILNNQSRILMENVHRPQNVIGVVQQVEETDEYYELTINLWDKFITQNVEYVKEMDREIRPISISIDFS